MTSQEGFLENSGDQLLNEAEKLIWSLLDENISETEKVRLEGMIQEHEEVRQRYLECTQMHADLTQHFQNQQLPKTPEKPSSPVLGSLGDIVSGTDSSPWPPVAE